LSTPYLVLQGLADSLSRKCYSLLYLRSKFENSGENGRILDMPTQTKARHVRKHHGTAVNSRSKSSHRSVRSTHTERSNHSETKAHPHAVNGYAKALRYLATLTDHERLRIVRYNSDTFDLNRMRTLLKRLGNPHEDFKSIHIAGTKGKGSTCAMTAS